MRRIAAEQAAEQAAERERALHEKEPATALVPQPKRQKERKGKATPKHEPPTPLPENRPAAAPPERTLPAVAASTRPAPVKAARKVRPAPQIPDEPFADFRAVVSGSSIDSVFKLMPITSWARPERPRPVEATEEQDDAIALLSRLKLPVPVSGFVYATGCRIRRVRVPSVGEQAGSVAGPVIVSRRALEELRTPR